MKPEAGNEGYSVREIVLLHERYMDVSFTILGPDVVQLRIFNDNVFSK